MIIILLYSQREGNYQHMDEISGRIKGEKTRKGQFKCFKMPQIRRLPYERSTKYSVNLWQS